VSCTPLLWSIGRLRTFVGALGGVPSRGHGPHHGVVAWAPGKQRDCCGIEPVRGASLWCVEFPFTCLRRAFLRDATVKWARTRLAGDRGVATARATAPRVAVAKIFLHVQQIDDDVYNYMNR
jgi:hypothetical protein